MDLETILIPIVDVGRCDASLLFGASLVQRPSGRLVALGVVVVEADLGFSEGAMQARSLRRDIRRAVLRVGLDPATVQILVRVARSVWDGISAATIDEKPGLILLTVEGDQRPEILEHAFVEPPPADIAVLYGTKNRDLPVAAPKKVLLAVRGGPHAERALEISDRLTRSSGGSLTLLRVEQTSRSPSERRLDDRIFGPIERRARQLPSTRLVTVRDEFPVQAIVRASLQADLLVVGASATEESPGSLGGSTRNLVSESACPVLVVRTRSSFNPEDFLSSPEPVDVAVERWFGERNYLGREFNDISELIAAKQDQGQTITLVLTVGNDELTAPTLAATLVQELVDRKPLIDEVIVADSGGIDDTVQLLRKLGFPVYGAAASGNAARGQVASSGVGRGESLWQAIRHSSGSLIAVAGGDIRNPHPRFVYGTLGPLLREPELQCVKGFSREPTPFATNRDLAVVDPITRLAVRPLLNLFFPELAGVIQPLGREFSVRRSSLQNVPFFTGDAVEIGILLDVFANHGLAAIGQSDLEERVGSEPESRALERVAFAVVQAIVQRMSEYHSVTLIERVNTTLKRVLLGEKLALEVDLVAEGERPPLNTLEVR